MLAGACAIQGYAVANGINTPNPLTVGGAFVAVGSVFGIAEWSKRRVISEEKAQGINVDEIKKGSK